MMQDLGPILKEITDEIVSETGVTAGHMATLAAKLAELAGQIDEIREYLEGMVIYARVDDEDEDGINIRTGWREDATDDQLHAAMVSIMADIIEDDRLTDLFTKATKTCMDELGDTSGRRS